MATDRSSLRGDGFHKGAATCHGKQPLVAIKGTPNKVTSLLKDAILKAAEATRQIGVGPSRAQSPDGCPHGPTSEERHPRNEEHCLGRSEDPIVTHGAPQLFLSRNRLVSSNY